MRLLRVGRAPLAHHPEGGHPHRDLRHRSGVTLAIARVIGETAPILVTAGIASNINLNVFANWMSTLPTFIYYQILTPTSPTNIDPSIQRAWAAALLLILMVMALNLVARLVASIFAPKKGR